MNERAWLVNARGKLTHEEVAKLIGITRQYYSMIENGTRTPSVPIAKRIGEILGVEWTIFFAEESNVALQI